MQYNVYVPKKTTKQPVAECCQTVLGMVKIIRHRENTK